MAEDDTTTDGPKLAEAPSEDAASQAGTDSAGTADSKATADGAGTDPSSGTSEPRRPGPVTDFAEELKSAVQSKLSELGMEVGADGKLDTTKMSPEHIKQGAQVVTGLMGTMMGALQQAAKKAGVDATIQGDGAFTPQSSGANSGQGSENVIDLASERNKREPRPPSAIEQRLTQGIKSAFLGYMRENAEIKKGEDGQDAADLNNDFVKNHAGKLMGTMFQAFAGAILPTQFEFGGKTVTPTSGAADGSNSGEEAAASDGGEAASGDELKVKMNLDLAGLFSQLIPTATQAADRKAGAAAKSETPPATAPTETDADPKAETEADPDGSPKA